MEIYQYHPSSFQMVKSILRKTQNAPKYGQLGRILFNETKSRFEHYSPKELDTIDTHSNYTYVEDAINNYHKFNENNQGPKMENVYENGVGSDVAEPNVNEQLEDNAVSIYNTVSTISQSVSQANKEKILSIISEVFKLDAVSESDILKTILEHGEYRKFLSRLLAGLGVEISFTKTTFDFQVSTANIKFMEQSEYEFKTYEKGVTQALTNLKHIKDTQALLKSKDDLIEQKDKIIKTLESKVEEARNQVEALSEKARKSREIKPVIPIYHVIMFEEDGKQYFVSVEKGANPTKDGSFPTKYLGKTGFVAKAKRFSSSDAAAQIAKMITFSKNVTFTSLEGKGPKELVSFFTSLRVLIEKPEAAE